MKLESTPNVDLLQEPRGRQADAVKLKEACRDFEALLTTQMLKSMRPAESDEASGLTLGKNNPLQDMFDWELARILSESSPFGIAETLMKHAETMMETQDKGRMDGEELSKLVLTAADKFDVDAKLIHAVIRAESNGDPNAISIKGARGLMQLTDETAARYGVIDPLDPQQNVNGGVAYLRRLLDRYEGDEELTLAAYNAGEAAVERFNGIPPYKETNQYIQRVLEFRRAGMSGSAVSNNSGVKE